MKKLPDKTTLHNFLSYDSISGALVWKLSPSKKIKAGTVAGSIRPTGYIELGICGTYYKAHRIVWLMFTGEDPHEYQIDHINGIKSDNRFSNLRLATASQNQFNKSGNSRNTSGHKGVTWSKKHNKWQAAFQCNKRSKTIGLFADIEQAVKAVKEAREKMHKEFHNHGDL